MRHYQGIAIDGESIAFVHISSENGQPIPGPIMPLSPDSVQMVFEACRQSCRRAVTATNLIEDFGHGYIIKRGSDKTFFVSNGRPVPCSDK